MAGINKGEFSIAREVGPLIKIRIKKVWGRLSKKTEIKTGRILIVDNCIIGDFLSTIPAIRELIKKRRSSKFDIIVSSPIKPLARKIEDINNVFVANTSYNREIEKGKKDNQDIPKEYDSIFILRISPESYRLIKDIRCSEIVTPNWVYLKYLLHIIKGGLTRKPIKQSREIIFDIIGKKKSRREIDKEIVLGDFFNFNSSDYRKITEIPEMQSKEKKVLIHTGSGWLGKMWEDGKWAEALKEVNKLGRFRFIFIGSDEQEKKSFEYIKKKLDFKIYSLIGKLDLAELFLVMKKSDYFIGVDSGPRNLAHFADLRSITILPPSSLRNFLPSNKKDVLIDKSRSLGFSILYLGKEKNMEYISPGDVIAVFKKLLKKE